MAANITKRETVMMYFLKTMHNTVCKVFTMAKNVEPESSGTSRSDFQFTGNKGAKEHLIQ